MKALPAKQRAALLGLYGGSLDGTPACSDDDGFKASIWRALKKKGLVKADPNTEDTLVLTRAGRSALGLRRRTYKTTVGSLRAAVRTLVPWELPKGSILTGSRLPSLHEDADDDRDDPVALSGHPDLIAAIPVGYPATLEPEAMGLDEDASFDGPVWADAVGVDEELGTIIVWQAVSQWMDELGHAVEISEEQGFQLVYRESS
jgi:hypothetical protein